MTVHELGQRGQGDKGTRGQGARGKGGIPNINSRDLPDVERHRKRVMARADISFSPARCWSDLYLNKCLARQIFAHARMAWLWSQQEADATCAKLMGIMIVLVALPVTT